MQEIAHLKIKPLPGVSPATAPDLEAFEGRHSLRLPDDYASFLLDQNGGTAGGLNSFIRHQVVEEQVRHFYGLCAQPEWGSLDAHYLTFARSGRPEILPVAEDFGGNAIVLLVDGVDRGSVFYFDSTSGWTFNDETWTRVADSFSGFLASLCPPTSE